VFRSRHSHIQKPTFFSQVAIRSWDYAVLDRSNDGGPNSKTLGSAHPHNAHATTLGECDVFAKWSDLSEVSAQSVVRLNQFVQSPKECGKFPARSRYNLSSGRPDNPVAPATFKIVILGDRMRF